MRWLHRILAVVKLWEVDENIDVLPYTPEEFEDKRLNTSVVRAAMKDAKLIYGKYPPIGAITYIWESKSPIGTMVPNPYSDRVRMVVLQSGSSKLGQWVTEERNVYEDYQTAFRQDPPNISGVAIMTDTDNTQETAIAYYGDIIFKKKQILRTPPPWHKEGRDIRLRLFQVKMNTVLGIDRFFAWFPFNITPRTGFLHIRH